MAESIADEVRGAQFGDERLTRRLVKIADCLDQKPNMSIPAASNGRAEMEGAYRFFDNSKVTPDAIVQPHITLPKPAFGILHQSQRLILGPFAHP